jgi:hypothetical protein
MKLRTLLGWSMVILGARAGHAAPNAASRAPAVKAEAATVAAALAEPGKCLLAGNAVIADGVDLVGSLDAPAPIARFSGRSVALSVLGNADGRHLRVAVSSDGLQLAGLVDADAVPLGTRREIALVAGHVWLRRGEPVSMQMLADGTLKVAPLFPLFAGVSTQVDCDAIGVGDVVAKGMSFGTFHLGSMLMKSSTMELYDAPGGSALYPITLAASDEVSPVFDVVDKRYGYVHVRHSGELIIDGWVLASSLKRNDDKLTGTPGWFAGPPGLPPASTTKAHDVTATRSSALRAQPNATARELGTVTVGAKLRWLEAKGGFARVLPRGLAVLPALDAGFWVKADDLAAE